MIQRAAIYCTWVVRDSLAVGDAKPTFRGDEVAFSAGRRETRCFMAATFMILLVESVAATLVNRHVKSGAMRSFWRQLEHVRHSTEFRQ